MQPTHVSDGYNVRVYGEFTAWVKRCKFEGWVWYDCNIKVPKGSMYHGCHSAHFGNIVADIRDNVVNFRSTIDSDENAWRLCVECIEKLSM